MHGKRNSPIYTTHAVEDSLARRGISKKDVEAVFRNHHTTYPGTNPKYRTVVLVGEGMNGDPLCVVVDRRRRRVVVTAYWRR